MPGPVAERDRDRLRDERRRRRDALLQPRREDERLEGRARLALRLRGEVELALAEVPSPDHCDDAAVARVDRDERGGRPLGIGEPLRDRAPRRLLQREVDRRRDAVAPAEHLGRAVLVDQLLFHVVREVRSDRRVHRRRLHRLRLGQRRGRRGDRVAARDLPLLVEQAQDQVAARASLARVRHGIELRRVLRHRGEERSLGKRQLGGAVAEVRERGLLDAIGAISEINRVQVRGEDPILVPALLELPGERRLLHLAADRAVVLDDRVLHELLRDRRATLHDALVRDVLPASANDSAEIDAVVLVEPPILDRDDRVLHQRRDLVRLEQHAALVASQHGQDRLAVVRVDVAVSLGLDLVAGVELRDLAGQRGHEAEREGGRAEQRQEPQEGEETELANPAPGLRRRSR